MVEPSIVITTFDEAKDAYRQKELRQALYDEGEVVMSDVLVNLHGDEHRVRRRVENRTFRRDTFELYEHGLFPVAIDQTLAPYVEGGSADLVHVGHELMLNLAALTAGVDRPLRTPEETKRLFGYMMLFIEGATLAHSTLDKDERREVIREALEEWDTEFLQPSIERRQNVLERVAAGELDESSIPRDVLTTLLRHGDDLDLPRDVLVREVAFFLLAGAHTSATAFVRSTDHVLSWLQSHPEDAVRLRADRQFVQRCVHETIRLNPSSPIGVRRALAPVALKSGRSVPEQGTLVVDLLAVNRDQSVFGPDAADFNPYRELPAGIPPYGLSFAAGMHVCIGQDLAAGVVPGDQAAEREHLFGLVTLAVQYLFDHGVRRDPDNPPRPDTTTKRPYWGVYPVLFGR